ncbi:MAG TPA: hypothetical protein PKL83_06675, partial [bacterium]|nr:hypothetical protein [bacterium]
AGADSNAGASSETKQEIQSLYSVVIGTPAEQLTIDSLLGVIDNNSTAALVLTLNNPGNVHTTASGKIDLIKDGVVAETYSVNSTNIFPGKSRDVTIQIDPLATAISDYTIKATLAYGKSNAILTFDGSWENASEIQTDTNTQVAKVKNSATVVAEENKSGSLIIYSILGAGLMLIAAGLVLSFKNKQA